MGSRVMHYCISTLLARELKIADPTFLLGGIAPDVHKLMNEPKSRSHFFRIDAEGVYFSDRDRFVDKYSSHMIHPFFLGYYYHLVSDDIWVKDIYYKKIKWLKQPEKKEAQSQYYRDFWRLNGKLIDYYSLVHEPMTIGAESIVNVIEEIDRKYLPNLVSELQYDFDNRDEAKDEDLEILDFDEVIEVLENTVRVCLADIVHAPRILITPNHDPPPVYWRGSLLYYRQPYLNRYQRS